MPDAPLPHMPPVQFAETNGIRMAYYEGGPRGGVPVVFCHGFPEIAFSWRHQLKALAEAGRWAVAPDQRGYGLTDRPQEVESYDLFHLGADLIGLIDKLGAQKAIWCGHDWGGFVVWQMALRYPDRTAGVIGLNTPYAPRGPMDPIAVMRARMGEEMYMVHFQKPREADEILGRDPEKTLSFMFRRPMPGQGPSAGLASERAAGQGDVFPLVRMIEAYDPAYDPREPFLTEEEFKVFVDTYRRTGFTGGINWYRNISRNWELSEHLPERITKPALMITAELDPVLPPSAADGMKAYVPDLDIELVRGSGHWTQQEKPDEVNRIILNWLDARFAKA